MNNKKQTNLLSYPFFRSRGEDPGGDEGEVQGLRAGLAQGLGAIQVTGLILLFPYFTLMSLKPRVGTV